MTGKQIVENLRNNAEKWMRSAYFYDGKYCVIGLKLHELGIPVEEWEPKVQSRRVGILTDKLSEEQLFSLSRLQHENDNARSLEELIGFLEEAPEAERNFPIEELAAALKS